MKKNIRLNKQIIKALSIGISAGMLLQPVAAYADELDTTEPAPGEGEETTAVPITATTQYGAAEAVADDADDEVEATVDLYEEAADIADEDAVPEEVWTAVTNLKEVIEENKEELEKDCDDAEAIIEDMDQQSSIISAYEVSANNLASEASAAASTADGLGEDAEDLADTTKAAVDAIADSVSANEAAIATATTVDEVNQIWAQIQNDVSGADAIVKGAEEQFNDIKTQYETAKSTFETKNAAYEQAVANLEAAKAEYERLRADAISGNDSEVGDALVRLAILEEAASDLYNVAKDASEEFEKKGYVYIAKLEEIAATAGETGDWETKLDPLFEAIIKYYYVPDMKNGVVDENFSCTWTKFKNNDKYNYCTVVYTVDGETVTETLNFRRADLNKSGGLIIFKKNPNSQNDNLNAGHILLAEYDRDDYDYITDKYKKKDLVKKDAEQTAAFREAIDGAPETAEMYAKLLDKLVQADAKYTQAEQRVRDLEEAIKNLELSEADIATVNNLFRDLQKAEATLKAASDKRDELLDKLDEIEDEVEDKIDDVTPTNPEGPSGPTGGPTGPTGGPIGPTTPAEVPEAPAAPAPAAPAFVPAAPAPAAVDIPEDETPLADAPDAQADVVPAPVDVADIDDDEVALAAAPVSIGDDATPLASVPEAQEMSWWWLLIVLVLGATGAEMYRRHMAKKKAAEINTDNK